MAQIYATDKNYNTKYYLNADLSGNVSRTVGSKDVTFKVSWSTSGEGYYGTASINGSTVSTKQGTVNNRVIDLGDDGTTDNIIKQALGTTVSVSLRCEHYYMYSGGSYKGAATGNLNITIPAAQFMITFDPNGGSIETNTKIVSYGNEYGELPTPIRSGYKFLGWFKGSNEVKSTSTVDIEQNTTLYAHWELQTVFHLIQNGSEILAPLAYIVEDGAQKQVVGLYVVENGTAYQCV